MVDIPFLRPNPPSLRHLLPQLAAIESSRIFTNYGPVNATFEQELAAMIERPGPDGTVPAAGECLTVCNATIGLMMAIRAVLHRGGHERGGPRRYALMPSFTFAAAAHAAEWCGLTPLFCDVDARDWSASAGAEDRLLSEYEGQIAVIVPYATFGNCIDLERYTSISARTGIPVVVDAAASLGSLDASGRHFGAGFPHPVVFSMHATKTFSTGEGGVIYSADTGLIRDMRRMGNFGFGEPRSATMPGLNSKLSEVGALQAISRLRGFDAIVAHRAALADRYRATLPQWRFQSLSGLRHAYQFMPLLPPPDFHGARDALLARLRDQGIGAAAYFNPPLHQQPFFRQMSAGGPLPITNRLARQVLALPLWDEMTLEMVDAVSAALNGLIRRPQAPEPLAARYGTLPPDEVAGPPLA